MAPTLIDINLLKENPDNPRTITDAKFAQLIESVKNFPQMLEVRPIAFKSGFVVLGGNMRLRACKAAGLKQVPAVDCSDMTEAQQREFVIKDNVGYGAWDWEAIQADWPEAEEWGLDIPDAFKVVPEAAEDDYEIPDEIETDIVLGDLFEIGEHRLLCGDSTDSDAVARLMNGQKAELLFTSPPYSDMREYNGEKDLSVSNIVEFIPTFMQHSDYQVINLGLQRKKHEINPYWDEYIQIAKDCGYKLLAWNVWSREGMGGSIANMSAMFRIEHEWIFVFGKEPKSLNDTKKNESAGLHTGITNRQKDGTTKKAKQKVVKEFGRLSSVITMCYGNSTLHPAVFPIDFPAEYIKAMTNTGDFIAEPFTGSGTTMVASHQLNRKCYGMELDPKYCQVIIDRMRKLDPNIPIKKNGVIL
jgi:DNA modification methylase